MPIRPSIIVTVFLLASFLPMRAAAADTGPKPTMDFEFVQEAAGPALAITSGALYECQQSDCSDAAPLTPGGPQGFTCELTTCHALAYGFSPFHRIEIQFTDGKTRQSNVFETAGFNSRYLVTIRDADLLVEAQTSPGGRTSSLLVTLICCCLVALILGLIGLIVWFLLRRGRQPGPKEPVSPQGEERSAPPQADAPASGGDGDSQPSAEHSG